MQQEPRGKDPVEASTPEWQLWENITSARLAAISYEQDAERFTVKAQESREKAELYQAALAKLTG